MFGKNRRDTDKTGIWAWKGLLASEAKRFHVIAFVLLYLVSASMTFTQFGFIGVGARGVYLCYILGLLGPIAACALLLGRRWAFLEGLMAGGVLYVHAQYMPLDFLERFVVTPLNSFVLYAMSGYVLGVAFAIALHNDPKGVRRVVYLVLACLVSSFIVSIAQMIHGFFDVVVQSVVTLAEQGPQIEALVDQPAFADTLIFSEMTASISALGGSVQLLFDFVFMSVVSIGTDLLVKQFRNARNHVTIRREFQTWLFVVVVLAFLIISAASFTAITKQSEGDAREKMVSETGFIANQLEGIIANAERIHALPELEGLSQETLMKISDSDELERLVAGYDLADGTIVVFKDGAVIVSDNPAYTVGSTPEEIFGLARKDVLKELANTGEMRTMLYDVRSIQELIQTRDDQHSTQLGYMVVSSVADYDVMMAMPASMVFKSRTSVMTWSSLMSFMLLMIMFGMAARLLNRIVVQSIDKTNSSLAKITAGDLDERVEERDNVEFSSLSDGINETVGALKGWITEAETRMERELATAKAIQESALPRTFPPFPEIETFDIYASMDAAKEVGGDFYDFFLVDDNTLGFLIADVSGKGVPGALFMMAAKTEIENYMSTGMDVAQAISSANRRLCANNDAGMFVTVWAATLNYVTGELTYVNAGHNPPLLRRGTSWEWLTKRCGLFLGTFDTAKYRQETIMLEPGDELLLYTDGVNEAFSVNDEEYGNDRLERFVADHNKLYPEEIVHALREDVAHWAEGAEQSDDVTILALEYGVAPDASGELTVPATIDHLHEAIDYIGAELDRRLCPVDVKHKVEVALE